MLEGFRPFRMEGRGAAISGRMAGEGPPLLLLHGYPQTHLVWRKVAPALARDFTVVLTDLRGYGDSGRPEDGDYSKRAMADDQVAVMRGLGFPRFFVAGHDRGGRVAHRMALDHPDAVARLAVLDIAPTLHMYRATDQAFATAYYHWFLLIQPFDLPERLIGADPEYFLRWTLAAWCKTEGAIEEEAVAAYLRHFRDPAVIHATCEDYRAAVGVDLVHDQADLGRLLDQPLLALWGERATPGRLYDMIAVWRERAAQVDGHALPCGHFLPEEAPAETLAALQSFFPIAPDRELPHV
ncbi:MAG: alpha/beta hydrolase [Alphaproteobacteria bacterium]|nr:alpha/beta hydrolase [Alphaproteobacteria bacterium]